MTELNIRQLMSGGIITNYFCTSRCGHCLYNCSPQWEKEYITAESAAKNLQAVRSLGCRSIHIGGGEPLLRPDGLAAVLKIAADLDVAVEYVETNSSWFKDRSGFSNGSSHPGP
jgi:molybdenum cofactor biosynthesis enzyme MoaA